MKHLSPAAVKPGRLTFEYCVLMGAYWAAYGCVFSFANILLTGKGFSTSQVGVVVAIGNVLGLIFQPVFAGIADRSKKLSLMSITMILSILGALLFGLIWLVPNIFLVVAAIFCITNALMQIIQPLTNSVSVYYVNQKIPVNFGIARAVGSVSFAVLTSFLGILVDAKGNGCIIIAGVSLIALMAILLGILPRIQAETDALEAEKEEGSTDSSPLSAGADSALTAPPSNGFLSALHFIGKYKRFFVVLLGATFVFINHIMVNNFLINIVAEFGGTSTHMGITMAIAAACEMPTMVFFNKLVKKINARKLLFLSVVFFTVKAVTYLFLSNVIFLYAVQVLQMAAYALYIPASVHYVNEVMAPEDKFKGQAFSVGATTLGSLLGSLLGGFLIDYINVRAMLIAGLILSAIGSVIIFFALLPTFQDKNPQ